jgi:hypothetical protein
MTSDVPSAPAESRPSGVVTAEQIRRWDLSVAVARKLLGEESSWAEIVFCARHLFFDDTLPT